MSFVPSLMSLHFVSHPMSPVLCFCFLFPVLHPLSHGSAPCLTSYVPCPLGSPPWPPRPLYYVYQVS
jgi:hypothetical protein